MRTVGFRIRAWAAAILGAVAVGHVDLERGHRHVDLDAARDALESKGVEFDGDTRTIEGMVKLATFFDPDGNKLNAFCMSGA